MNTIKNVLFDDALTLSIKKAKEVISDISDSMILVRDLRGRIRILLPGIEEDYDEKRTKLNNFSENLSSALGAYGFPSDRMVLFAGNLEQGGQIFSSKDCLLIHADKSGRIFLLDRQIVGQDWLRQPFERESSNPRVTFYGVKGGVGRSTALIIWAWRLAKQGKRVLIFDLDLESPGVSSTLLPMAHLPDYGIVDWFVEDGVGQGSVIEWEMTATSPISNGLTGEIRVIPSYGRKTDHYLSKLARCYSDSTTAETTTWGERLERFVSRMESAERPDVVILDSRAGIHDIAAVAITRMDADSFLFAADSPQTWSSYTFLFRHLKQNPDLDTIRDRIQIVSSMVPETGRSECIRKFREHAWDVFRENLYDDASPEGLNEFSFDIDDEDAPHFPWPVYWHRALQEFNPTALESGLDIKTAEEALGNFMDRADAFISSIGGSGK